jgi:hypothetical protein
MVNIHTFAAAGADTGEVLAALGGQIEQSGIATVHFVMAFFGCDHDAELIRGFLGNRFPSAAIIGGTSNTGLMTDHCLWGKDAIGLFAIEDADGQYGVAIEPVGDNPTAAAEKALTAALENATCPGELPSLIFVYQAPGSEEDVIDGFRNVVGDGCPTIGGSSADNDTSGRWRQIANGGTMQKGIAVAVLFPSGAIGTVFQGGFEPAGPNGIVTRVIADGNAKSRGHQVAEIDGRPAALVYDEWSNNILGDKAANGGNVFEETSAHPFGIEAGDIDGVTNFITVHPVKATPEGGMTTFAAVEEGAHIHIMRGNKKRLAQRAGHVAAGAVSQLPSGEKSLSGALMVFCAGCKRAIGERLPEVAHDVAGNFDGRPFLCCFTFGEQGFISGKNAHGNLMIAAVAFGK